MFFHAFSIVVVHISTFQRPESIVTAFAFKYAMPFFRKFRNKTCQLVCYATENVSTSTLAVDGIVLPQGNAKLQDSIPSSPAREEYPTTTERSSNNISTPTHPIIPKNTVQQTMNPTPHISKSTPIKKFEENLWDISYEQLRSDPKKKPLIQKYEQIILRQEDLTTLDIDGREQRMSRAAQDLLQQVKETQFKFAFFSKEIAVRQQLDRVVGAVIWAKDLVTATVGGEPHAAIAWAGICVLLPVSITSFKPCIFLISATATSKRLATAKRRYLGS